MGKKDKNKKKGKGAEKTQMKTDKKLAAKQKKLLEKIGEADIQEIVAKLESEEQRLTTVTETVCDTPSARSSFSLCTHPEKEELIMFGGEFYNGQKMCVYNDMYFYNIPKKEWRLVKSPQGPTPRSSHQMVAVASDGGQLWLFGGEHASPSQLQFYHYKDLWVFRMASKKWEKINASDGPSARSGHRMVAAKKKLFIFGGFRDNNIAYQYFNDVHVFSMESYTWLKIEVSGAMPPAPRSGCCMAATPDGKILIWGGYTKSKVNKEIDRGVTHTDTFSLVPDKSDPTKKFKWVTVKPSGSKPLPRSGVSFTVAPNGKAYCFGGVMDVDEEEDNLSGQFSNELHSLDLTSTAFRYLEIIKKEKSEKAKSEDAPQEVEMEEASSAATPVVSSDGVFTVTVGGGSGNVNNEEAITSLFAKLKAKPVTGPHPRMNAGLAVCKGTLYLFGGIYEEDKKQTTLGDFHSLDLHKLDEWKAIVPLNPQTLEWADSGSEDEDSGGSDKSGDDESEDDSDSDMDTD